MSAKKRPSPRPKFTLQSPLDPTELRARVKKFLDGNQELRGIALDHRIELSFIGDQHHFYSPQVLVHVRPADAGGSRLEAQLGPDPHIWSLYIFTYVSMVILAVFAAVFGSVQWSLGHSPVVLALTPLAVIIAALVYGASFVGQGLGAEQMYILRSTLTKIADTEYETLA